MECNKDEAVRAKKLAETKMANNDFEGARKIALKAQKLYPELDIMQMLNTCDVHCSAKKRLLGSENDWYEILQVKRFADEITVKKQYRRLALILHPDKNRYPGAEGAFKLIHEANALLSNPERKSLYDNKIRVISTSTPANLPNHQMNRSSQFHQNYGAQSNSSNSFGIKHQDQATQSAKQGVFWTFCPFCKVRFQYLRIYIHKSLQCSKCKKIFIAEEISVQSDISGSKLGQQGPQHVPPKPGPSPPADFQEKVVPETTNFKRGVPNAQGPSESRRGCGSEGVKVESASENMKTKETNIANVSSLHGGKKGMSSDSEAIHTESRDLGNKTRQRGKKEVVESRIGCGSEGVKVEIASGNMKTEEKNKGNASSLHGGKKGMASDSDSICRESRDVANKTRKRGKTEVVELESSDNSDTDIENLTTQQNFGDAETDVHSESGEVQFVRRSSRKRHHAIYEDSDEDDDAGPFESEKATIEDKGKEQKGSADTIEMEIDSEGDVCSSEKSDLKTFDCPEPEFSDFNKLRDESQFDVNQFWACYDNLDSMPRFYAKVKKVYTSPFKLLITWLEAKPIDTTFEEWIDEELPAGCGNFKLGITEETDVHLSFSHQMCCGKGEKRGSLIIYPREGEVWAVFKDWDKSWSSDPKNHKEFKYEVVEVLSDFIKDVGIKVCYLDKVAGFVSLFERPSQYMVDSFVVRPNEVYRFSHRVPCSKMTGAEGKGVPVDSFELDSASLPLNPDDLYYPSKADSKRRNTDSGVNSSQPKNAKEKGKSVVSEGSDTPKKFADLNEIKGEMSKLRRSPRGVHIRRPSGN